MPSFFNTRIEEPSFAQFNPPFGASGMFVDFLKTIGDVEDTIPFQNSRTYVDDSPRSPELVVHKFGSIEDTSSSSEFKETPR